MSLSKEDRASARKIAAEWARRYYADAVSDAGRVADAEKRIRADVEAEQESAAQFLTASKSEFSSGIDADELWAYFWPEAAASLKRRLNTGIGSRRRNPSAETVSGGSPSAERVAFVPRRGRASGSEGIEGMVNINTATSPQLQMLPGIGPRVAHEIIALRKKLGKFVTVDTIRDDIDGVGDAVFARIRPHLALSGETKLSRRLEPDALEKVRPGDGVTLRVRFETDLGFTIKEVEVTCAESKPQKIKDCATATIEKHIAAPALRDVTLAIATSTIDGSVVLMMKVNHCTDCDKDGHPRLRDVRRVQLSRDDNGLWRIRALFNADGANISSAFRKLDLWHPFNDRAALESAVSTVFPSAQWE